MVVGLANLVTAAPSTSTLLVIVVTALAGFGFLFGIVGLVDWRCPL